MKKIICLLLTFCLMFSLAACGGGDENLPQDDQQLAAGNEVQNDDDENVQSDVVNPDDESAKSDDDEQADTEDEDNDSEKSDKKDESKKPESDKAQTTSSNSKPASSKNDTNKNDKQDKSDKSDKSEAKTPTSALNLLNTVWKSYKSDEKFPAGGGDYSEENHKDDAPGKFDVSDKDSMQSMLAVSEEAAEYISGAASLVHMMNLNTFTAGSFKTASKSDAKNLAEAMKDSIKNRRWMCGFPDKFVIITIDKYVLSVYGGADLVDTFKAKTQKAFPSAKIYCEENVE